MSENKKATPKSTTSKAAPRLAIKKKPINTHLSKKSSAIAKAKSRDLGQAFDDTFKKFRSDFENLVFPISDVLLSMPEVRVPAIDLQDREKDYLLKAEMPGFKKEEIEINVHENGVEITGTSGWKYDEKEQAFICKERACKTFYRYVDLPEKIKVSEVNANLSSGVLEVTLPKKAPKQKLKNKNEKAKIK